MEKMSQNLHFRLVNIRRYYLSLVFPFLSRYEVGTTTILPNTTIIFPQIVV